MYITPDLFSFFRDLKTHNDREWFADNKGRYEAVVKEPLLGFIAAFGPLLHAISHHFLAIPKVTRGSLFRIYRDTRFSADKSPYKTHAAVHFRHERSRDAHAPGFYLHLEPDSVMAGLGLWHPDAPSLRGIRDAIASDPDAWHAATCTPPITDHFVQAGERLQRPPKGYDASHPLIAELKRKDFYALTTLTESEACDPAFLERLAARYAAGSDMMSFLCGAVGVPW